MNLTASSVRFRRTAAVLCFCFLPGAAYVQTDPLPSWNDGPAKQAILEFVRVTTDETNPKYVAPEDRIATFDQDGTTWVEHPMYAQVMYCLDRVPAVVAQRPELKNVEPFQTVLSGDQAAIARLSMPDLEKVLAATLSGMTLDDFVIGTAGGTSYGYTTDGKPMLTKEPELLLNDDKAGKPEGIHLMIGRRPHAALRQLGWRPTDARVHAGRRRRPG